MKHKSLKMITILTVCCLMIVGCGAVVITPDHTIVVQQPERTPASFIAPAEPSIIIPSELPGVAEYSVQNSLAAEIFKLINAERFDHGLSELTYNADLQSAANIRAEEASQMFSHTRPDGSSCHSIVEDFDYYVTGENLILAQKEIASAKRLVEEWMNSEGHRYNILLPDFTSTAIGISERDGYVFAAQIFLG